MRFQRALPVIGCGSLSILALVIGGCSSKSSNNTDSGVDSSTMDAPWIIRRRRMCPRTRASTRPGRGGRSRFKPPTDVRDTNGSICTGIAPIGAADFRLCEHQQRDLRHVRPGSGGRRHVHQGARARTHEDYNDATWHITGHGVQPPRSVRHLLELHRRCQRWLHAGRFAVAGISFTIKGNVGPDNAIGFTMGRADNDTPPENATCGTCVPAADAATAEDSCHGPRTTVTVPADHTTTKTVTLHWTRSDRRQPAGSRSIRTS